MRDEDLILAILYLNEKKGRKLNELGLKKIAKSVGVENVEGALEELLSSSLVSPNLELTERGREEALSAIKRIEKEVRRGMFGGLNGCHLRVSSLRIELRALAWVTQLQARKRRCLTYNY